jgi:type I restriction enzyme R subunit
LGVPFIFLANGEEVWFWEHAREAHPRPVKTFYAQTDLERRIATLATRADPLQVPIDRRIVERGYQVDCIDVLCKEINQGRRKLLVEMATGTGKTRMAAALIKRLFEANAVTRVLFLVDRITLAHQTEDAFTEHLRGFPCYVLRAGKRFQDAQRITITTLQSMINVYRDYSSGYFDLVITDECHRSIYGKWRKVLEHFDGIQIGLTATPCVAVRDVDGTDEDQLFVRDTLRFFEVDRPTFTYTLKQAIDDGYLVGYQIYRATTVKTAAEGGFEVKRDEILWDELDDRTREELREAFGDRGTITVDPNALERRFTIPERNRAIVREFRQVMDDGYHDARGTLRKPLIGKTIVFAVTKRHAATLAELIDREFAHLKPSPEVRYADYVVSGLGRDDTVDGIGRIRRFKKEKFPQVLVSVNMLDTGFDCPEVVNLVFARFTKSQILYRQMRGRGTRRAPGKAAFTMFDFVGVTDFHQDDETWAEGTELKDSRKREKYTPRRLVTVDADDWIDPASRAWINYDEQGNVVFPDPTEEHAAELGTRFEAWMVEREFTPEQERWLHWVESQIRENATVFDDFTLDHLEFPPFSRMGGRRKAAELFGGDDQLARLVSDLRAAVFSPH